MVTIDLRTHSPIWSTTTPSIADGTSNLPATDGATVYIADGDKVLAYASDSGALRGTYDANDPAGSSRSFLLQPLVTNDLLIFASDTQTFIFDKATFHRKATLPTGGYLSYARGVLYTASPAGVLASYVFEGVAEPPSPPRPSPTPFASRVSTARARVDLVSINDSGTAMANSPSFPMAISGNGRYVLFSSFATDVTGLPDNNHAVEGFGVISRPGSRAWSRSTAPTRPRRGIPPIFSWCRSVLARMGGSLLSPAPDSISSKAGTWMEWPMFTSAISRLDGLPLSASLPMGWRQAASRRR